MTWTRSLRIALVALLLFGVAPLEARKFDVILPGVYHLQAGKGFGAVGNHRKNTSRPALLCAAAEFH